MEDGTYVHPRIAAVYELLKKGQSNDSSKTKTSCGIRAAIVHAALQRVPFKKCIHCHKPLRNIRYLYRKLVYYITANELKTSMPEAQYGTGQNKSIFADECRKFLRQIYSNYPDLLILLFPVLKINSESNACPIDIFFLDTIPVIPPKARPPNVLHDQIVEHPQTGIYRAIIENNAVLRVVMKHLKGLQEELSEEAQRVYENTKGNTSYEKLYNSWQTLQTSVDLLLDITASRDSPSSQGLKQILEKKEGLIRKHMMGKRVNYAARTVITPDPNINVEEIGIPDIFARKLSYPVPVTPWNVAELRKMVMNGPNYHPGANYIQDEKGYTTLIPGDNAAKRESMAKLLFNYPENGIKIVHRHVLNGDIFLLNRQPSLHRPSIMAHKARILPGEKTFRLHYSNCKAYNADFDGDEMNAHFPQSEVARAEAYNLVNVSSNYLVPKDGTPLGGLIQDHVISGVKLSIRGRFFNREDYQQLVYQGLSHLRDNIKHLGPTILKPVMLWSGKQVLSTIIINLIPKGYPRINLHTNAKISSKHWIVSKSHESTCGDSSVGDLCESNVIIHKGELLTGVLDKQQYGATTYGLIHCIYELYGGEVSTSLLTSLSKVFTAFLQKEGFTLGVKDILLTSDADAQRRKLVKECRKIGDTAVAVALDLEEIPSLDVLVENMEEAYLKDPKFRVILDRKYKSLLDGYTNDINRTCLPDGLISRFPLNNLQLMVLSGAKGSMVNTMQISCLLGQIELEGKRPPLMISGKSLPSFTSFETSPKSGGFIDGRFMTGIQPQDFFFHCMAGREGLIDTAVKTSRSGYLQRCLIKHLEGLTVGYDMTVRDSDNSVVQYLYGEDGLDILKSKFFNTNFCMQFLALNYPAIMHSNELSSIKDAQIMMTISRHVKKIRKCQNKHKEITIPFETDERKIRSAFVNFSSDIQSNTRANKINPQTGRSFIDEHKQQLWREADAETKEYYKKHSTKCPDPTTSIYRQHSCYGSVSERLEKVVEDYMKKYPNRKATIDDIIYLKNLRALVPPGEPVGLLAAQSIGEPSTQMTLNTFHFAGRGEMNVTLGIPRLREILMLASANIKTPSMDIPIKIQQTNNADTLRVKLNRVTLSDILQFVNVKVKLVLKPDRSYQYMLHFNFLPREAYQGDFCVRPKKILKYMSESFFKLLFRAIVMSSKSKSCIIDVYEDKGSVKGENSDKKLDEDEPSTETTTREKTTNNVDLDSSDDENMNDEDNDALGSKLKARKQDETEYDDPEDLDELKDADDDYDIEECEYREDQQDISKIDTDDAMVEKVLSNEMVQGYSYDKENHLWCELTFKLSMRYRKPDISSIIRELANKCVIHQVQNIKRAILYKGETDVQLLKTDGINIVEMFKYNKILELNRLYSNDIHAIAHTYGIEAAAQIIIKEVQNVFKVYGIAVDRRHLSLIADYMTFDGTFQPLSRKGMEHSASPLQQMSFESCLQFLKNAAGSGRFDELSSPSSRLMVGLPVRNGTGAFELLTKVC
ncbi:DNA-directed RNA polymerase I subunit RPA1 isoform X2 [Eurosta solidaginis]